MRQCSRQGEMLKKLWVRTAIFFVHLHSACIHRVDKLLPCEKKRRKCHQWSGVFGVCDRQAGAPEPGKRWGVDVLFFLIVPPADNDEEHLASGSLRVCSFTFYKLARSC